MPGSIKEVSVKGRTLQVAADTDANNSIGGLENEVDVDGNGGLYVVQTRKPGMVGPLEIMAARKEERDVQQFLQDLADKGEPFDFTYTEVDGSSFGGRAQIQGTIERSTAKGRIPVTFAAGVMTPQ